MVHFEFTINKSGLLIIDPDSSTYLTMIVPEIILEKCNVMLRFLLTTFSETNDKVNTL